VREGDVVDEVLQTDCPPRDHRRWGKACPPPSAHEACAMPTWRKLRWKLRLPNPTW
jgi:hypothetical protein